MKWFRSGGVLVAGLLWLAAGVGCADTADGEEKLEEVEAVVIPLDQIWALDMPGTRDIYDYDFNLNDPRQKGRGIPGPLRRNLWLKSPKGVLSGFMVRQTDRTQLLQLLQTAGRTVSDEGSYFRHCSYQSKYHLSLVFYSHPSAYRVELTKVERRGLVLDIHYRFVPRFSVESSVHFALIPFGKLPAGDYRVEMTQVPMEQKHLDAGFKPVSDEQASRIVCRPFSFHVWDPPAPDPGPNENAVEIPLDQIWAYQMPGTRPMEVEQRDGAYVSPEGPLLDEIRRVLVVDWREGPKLLKDGMPGFAVLGSGMDALREAHAVLVKKQEPRKSFPEDAEISLVFFSNPCSRYVHLHRVEREGNRVKIRYRFVSYKRDRDGKMGTKHFALIPLGKLAPGNVQAKVIQSPMEQRHEDSTARHFPPEEVRLTVCKSFSFSVDGDEKPEETVVIPLDQIWAYQMPGTRDIRELQADKLPPSGDGLLVRQIRRSLSKDRPKGEAARAGFAVLGTGLEALREAHAILVEGKKPRESFPVGSDLTLVFFSQRLLSYYVHVCEVVQEKNTILIRYRFVPHKTKELTTHFALVPIVGLAEGGCCVRVTQNPMEPIFTGFKKIDAAYERTIISGSFSFEVSELTHD